MPTGCAVAYVIVRGYEQQRSQPLVLSAGLSVPSSARLELQRLNSTFQPLSFVTVASVPSGRSGVMYLSTMAIATQPAGNNYIEGCWHLYTNSTMPFPGVIVGTGCQRRRKKEKQRKKG